MRRIALGLFAIGALAACGSDKSSEKLGRTEQALSTNLVISGIWGGPGTGTTEWKNDWIEIFNRGSSAVTLDGKTLQYSRTDYQTWADAANKIALTGSIPAGGYLLVKLGANSGGTNDITADVTPTSTYQVATGGALVAIVDGTTTLDCGPPVRVDGGIPDGAVSTPCSSTSIIDFVGYGKTGANPAPAPVYEGSGAAPTGVATSVLRRKGDGCVETDDNNNDFELVAIASGGAPRNSTSPVHLCSGGDAGADADADDVATADADDATPADTTPADTADTTPADTTPADTATSDTTPADTSVADTGTEDTATPADTGTTPADTGTPATDTGTVADTGAPTDEVLEEDDGCSCRMPGRDAESRNTASALGIAALAGLVAARRRRR